MLPGAIVLPVTLADAFRILWLPVLSVGMAGLIMLPGLITGLGTSTVPKVFALVLLAMGAVLLIMEVRDLRSYVITYDDLGIGLVRGKNEVLIPWFGVQSVTVLNLVPRKGRAIKRTAIEIAVNREGAEYARRAPELFHAIEVPEREVVTMFVGSGEKRQNELDRALASADVRRYLGIKGHYFDNRRMRYGMDPSVHMGKRS